MKLRIAIIWLAIVHAGIAGEKVNFFMPAQDELWGIKHLTVADFRYGDGFHPFISEMVESALRQHDFFRVVTAAQVAAKCADTTFSRRTLLQPDSMKAICDFLRIDAIISGDVLEYHVPPDSLSKEIIKRTIWTGEYERDEEGHIIQELESGVLVRKKKFVERTVELSYRIRTGVVTIVFIIWDGENGIPAVTDTIVQVYDSAKIYEDEQVELPDSATILNNLCRDAVDVWVTSISPYSRTTRRDIADGNDLIHKGKVYATNGLWEEAIRAWQQAVDQDTTLVAGYYNLGLAYEALAEYDLAILHYKRAFELDNSRRYRKVMENLEKQSQKRKQLLKRKQKRE